MEKAYEPGLHDERWQKFWTHHKLFNPEVSVKKHVKPSGQTFTLCMPPPNVTGVLHQGHALMLTLEDTLIRWHRMLGDETLYLPGTDHASIAVQMQVVKFLESKGISHKDIGREKFLEHCWDWIREYQPRIFSQIQCLGTSCDWSRARFTMEPKLNVAVTEAFVRLYEKGLIYRAEKLVNWSPKGQTGLSDLEVIYEEREGNLWHIRYPVEGMSGQFLVVATTRPETMLGDTAVAVHPDDVRYQKLIGKFVILPITNRKVPIIADSFVEKDFGTGVVKITPAHDHNDFECGQRHQLAKLNIFTKEAKIISGLAGEGAALSGLDRFEARDKILASLSKQGLLEKTEKHKNRVGISERWGDVVEPYLSYQWFMKTDSGAKMAMESVRNGDVKIVPHEFHNQFMRWMENIHDWCISRQLWWGQQIPAWHCSSCSHIQVARVAPSACSKCKSTKLEADPDVLDTWFSSGLWPFAVHGWPNEKEVDYQKFFPSQVMETGFDILFFWVARMMMMSLELTGKNPFEKVYLHPMVRDEHGQKMSKTKGNVIDPLDIVKKYGADTLRFTLNALCIQGRDLKLSEERIEGYRNFINKVWNASKFVLMGADGWSGDFTKRPEASGLALHDRWILNRLDVAARDVHVSWSEFKMQEAAETLYHFIWNDFCDWYIEASKMTKEQSQHTLLYVLGEALKLLHPLCPHVTEEIYHHMPGVQSDFSLMTASFPRGDRFPEAEVLAKFQFLQNAITAIRTLRAESKVPPAKKIRVHVRGSDAVKDSLQTLKANESMLQALAKLDGVTFSELDAKVTQTKVVVAAIEASQTVEFQVALTELVDLEEEKKRLQKEIEQLDKYVTVQGGKLENKSFVERAPPEVIQKERMKLAETQEKLQKLKSTYESLK